MNTSEYTEIPFLRANISIAKSHPHGAIIYDKQHSFHLKVSEAVYQIIAHVNGINSIENIQSIYNKKYNTSISHEKVKGVIYNLLGNRVIQGDQHEPIKSNPIQHIKLQRLLIDTQKIKQLIQGLEFFYSQRGILVFLTLSICTFYLNINTSIEHNSAHMLIQIILISVTTIVHELGHITACQKYNIKSKGIGIGLYLGILPVAYADVSGIWLLKKQERIIVNLSGIYLELIFLCMIYIVSQLAGTENLKSLSLLLIFKCFFNFQK